MAPTIVLITGANRGIGKGLLTTYLARPDHIVIASVRNPADSSARDLVNFPTGAGSRLIIVKIDSTVESDAKEAVSQLAAQGIDHLDIVIANAGVASIFPSVEELRIADLKSHIDVNVYGLVYLYQATLPLLRKAAGPKWVTIGSSAGFIVNPPPIPNAAYAPSKIAAHWLTKRINTEEPELTAWVFHPGWVQTDGGNASARFFGLEEAPTPVDESIKGMVKVIDQATKEATGGNFWNYDGDKLQW
ncbi:hypothetical protein B0T25DRAFT_504176 [Lasiosphaeria hispida]|uniref:Aflatoxin biosynthesis ketoreductase nor-1 n=1 Tax=Lasiosphaeria hispida TaxID=260671 RepID=A0AAJ0HE61_9PEZI|nr:hypothetical protein B0T25DRAFT_504176 [Lasiosphaeria hispida]